MFRAAEVQRLILNMGGVPVVISKKFCIVVSGTMLAVVLTAGVARATVYAPGSLLPPEDFTYIGSPSSQTKWNPGPNSASIFPHVAPAGPMTPGSATWSVMAAGLGDASGFDAHGALLTTALSALTASDETAILAAAMAVWDAASDFTSLGPVADGGVGFGALVAAGGHLGDIRVGAVGGFSGGVLAHAYQPGTQTLFGPGGTIAGDMHIANTFVWVDDPADDLAGPADFDLFTVMLHELGHSLGLGHSIVAGSVMEPVYAGSRRTLHADDIAGIRAIYGPAELDAVVPEPSTYALGLIGLAGLGLAALRRGRRA